LTSQEQHMKKNDPPQAFGVFKPVGHVVLSFKTGDDAVAAVDGLAQQGFAAGDLVRYTPAQMMAQVDGDLREASPLASIGQEMNLVKAHRALAEAGFSFVVVRAPDDEAVDRVVAVARSTKAYTAQRYGTFIIEELIDRTPGQTQVFESPARGLDMDVPGRAAR
jgi:hypothetical protein